MLVDRYKPMVSGTIKSQMEALDGSWYKNVREIHADVRLVFTSAMKHNDDQSDIHAMAKSLLEKFEEKWLQLLPKVVEEVDLSYSYFFSHLLLSSRNILFTIFFMDISFC